MSAYTFDTEPNAYFLGQDVRVTDHANGATILVNVKDGMWAVNVKDDVIHASYPRDIQNALDTISEREAASAYNAAIESWWDDAQSSASERGFEDGVNTAGRSSGWMALPDTSDWEPTMLLSPKGQLELTRRDRFLSLGFEVVANIDKVRESVFFENVRSAMLALQTDLSQFTDWVGAEVQTLDGQIEKVERILVRDGRPCLDFSQGFAFANEAKLVRKADGGVPARVTANPFMELVFQIIEARGLVNREQLDAFLEEQEGNEPARLYEDFLSPAISELEHRIREAN